MLTDAAVKSAKPEETDYKNAVEKGLYLLVTKAGGKLWRMDYRFDGKHKTMALGQYPEITLKDARERRDDARKLLANGIDPGQQRKEEKSAKEEACQNTFGAAAAAWFEKWRADKSDSTIVHVRRWLDDRILPFLADKSIATLKSPEILEVLQKIERENFLVVADRVRKVIGQILDYAIYVGKRELVNPCAALSKAIKHGEVKHRPAFVEPVDVAELMRKILSYQDNPRTSIFVRSALKLSPLLLCRPGELIAMKWADVDLKAAEWSYLVGKVKKDHIVPLSKQAVEILRGLEQYRDGEYVFPCRGRKGRHMSNMTVNRALQSLEIDTKEEHCAHGFRATARTMLAERLGMPDDWVQLQLSHRVPDPLGMAYFRAKFLPQRKKNDAGLV